MFVLAINIILFLLNYAVDLVFIKCFTKISWKQACKITLYVAVTSYMLQLVCIIVIPPFMFIAFKLLEYVNFLKPFASLLSLITTFSAIAGICTNISSTIVSSKLKLEFKNVCWWMFLAQATFMLIIVGICLFIGKTSY